VKQYTVKQYETKYYQIWNTFLSDSRNGTFLFHRDFMEYHKNRFEDFSLLIFEDKKLVSIFPANRAGETLFSHQGLTYGGLLFTEKTKLASVIAIYESVLKFLALQQIKNVQIKVIPSIYNKKPSEELLYALFLSEAKLIRRDSLSVIDLSKINTLSTLRKRGVKKGIAHHLEIKEVAFFEEYWKEILIPNLEAKHQSKPVHTVDEIKLLHTLFPKNIRQFNVYDGQKIVAGTTIFESDQVAHAQYISANETREFNGCLDFLFNHLIENVFKHKLFFDFGISNEAQGKKLNEGLSYWKESFGASTIVQDFYEVQTSNYRLLTSVMI
jgi:hypothetical protein